MERLRQELDLQAQGVQAGRPWSTEALEPAGHLLHHTFTSRSVITTSSRPEFCCCVASEISACYSRGLDRGASAAGRWPRRRRAPASSTRPGLLPPSSVATTVARIELRTRRAGCAPTRPTPASAAPGAAPPPPPPRSAGPSAPAAAASIAALSDRMWVSLGDLGDQVEDAVDLLRAGAGGRRPGWRCQLIRCCTCSTPSDRLLHRLPRRPRRSSSGPRGSQPGARRSRRSAAAVRRAAASMAAVISTTDAACSEEPAASSEATRWTASAAEATSIEPAWICCAGRLRASLAWAAPSASRRGGSQASSTARTRSPAPKCPGVPISRRLEAVAPLAQAPPGSAQLAEGRRGCQDQKVRPATATAMKTRKAARGCRCRD